MYLAVSLFATIIIFLLWRASHSAKTELSERALHSRAVVVSIIFSILVVVFFVQILRLINLFFSLSAVRNFLFYIMPAANSSGAFFWIVTLASCLFIAIAFVILAWLVYAVWLNPMSHTAYLRTKNPIEKFFNKISSLFYYTDSGEPEIKPIAQNIGHWLRYMRNIFGVLLLIEAVAVPVYLHFNMTFIDADTFAALVKSLYLIPVVSFFLLDQIVIMLQCDEKDDVRKLMTEELSLTHVGDYSNFVELFDKTFHAEALITSFITESKLDRKSLFSEPDSEQLKRAADPELLSAVCRNVNNTIHPLSINYTDALVDLINGNNIIIADSYCGEFILYYLSFIQHNLLKNRKALIIVDHEHQVKKTVDQFKEIFNRINKINPIWKIKSPDNLTTDINETDILVCTEEQFFMGNIAEKYPEFCDMVYDVLVLDIYGILCRNKSFMVRFFNAINDSRVQVVFMSEENNADIKAVIRENLNNREISMYSGFNENIGTCILCWRGESFYKPQLSINPELYHDFGLAYTIAIIAGKYDVSRVNIHAPDFIPIETYSTVVHSYSAELVRSYFMTDSVSLDSIVRLNPITAFRHSNLSFDIYYDGNNNLINIARAAMSCSAEYTSMIHIISRPYMLRDYFAYNLEKLSHNLSGVQFLVSGSYGALRPASVVLFIKMRSPGMTTEEIVEYMRYFGADVNNAEEALALALKETFSDDPEINEESIYSYFSFGEKEVPVFDGKDYRYTRVTTLTSEILYQKAKLISENFVRVTGNHTDVLPISKESVYNYYLPGQVYGFAGKRYLIQDISNGTINAALEETVERDLEYTSYYELKCDDEQPEAKETVKVDDISLSFFSNNISRKILGYFSHINGLDFNPENKNTLDVILNTPIEESRTAEILKLDINFPFKETYENAAAMFVMLFRGVLETALPHNYKDILTVSKININELKKIEYRTKNNRAQREDPLPSDWIKNKDYKIPLSQRMLKLLPRLQGDLFESNSNDCIHLYFICFNPTDNSTIKLITENMDRLLTILRNYMEWATTFPLKPHAYLKFGYNAIPLIFDSKTAYNCLQKIAVSNDNRNDRGRVKISELNSTGPRCSFCGRPTFVSYWAFDKNDRRIMCEDCYKHRTTEREEVNRLLIEAYETLENTYNITLPKGIKIRFASAATIRASHGADVSDSRIIGLYIPSKKEIWIERGGPAACVMSTLMHELTHAWQFANLEKKKLNNLDLLEGHSTFVEIECTRLRGDTVYADYWERQVEAGNDEYSRGLSLWKNEMANHTRYSIFRVILRM